MKTFDPYQIEPIPFYQPDLRPIRPDQVLYKKVKRSFFTKLYYQLFQPYFFEWVEKGIRYRLCLPGSEKAEEALQMDGASIHQLMQSPSGMSPDGPHRPGTVMHDPGYRYRGKFPRGWLLQFNEKKQQWEESDRIFTKQEIDNLWVMGATLGGESRMHINSSKFIFSTPLGWWVWKT